MITCSEPQRLLFPDNELYRGAASWQYREGKGLGAFRSRRSILSDLIIPRLVGGGGGGGVAGEMHAVAHPSLGVHQRLAEGSVAPTSFPPKPWQCSMPADGWSILRKDMIVSLRLFSGNCPSVMRIWLLGL